MGEPVEEPVDHPIIRPSINAVAKTYDLANEDPALASAVSPPNRRSCEPLPPRVRKHRRPRYAE
jgi:aromatic ring hydroxylase